MTRRDLRVAVVLISLLVVGGVGQGARADAPPAPPPAPPALRDVSALLAPLVAKHEVPALCGGIVVGPGLVAVGVDGVRRRGFPERASVEDRWHLGSCTKAMTATLCALLEAEGKLTLSTTLKAALGAKDLGSLKAHPGWYDVTVEQLLAHRGGAPSNLDAGGLWGRLWQRKGTPREQRQELLEGLLPQAPCSGAYVYSNSGYALAGILCERAASTPDAVADYETLMQERLFAPLKITSAGLGAPGAPGRFDQPRGHDAKGRAVEPSPQADNPPAIAPAGTAHMTLADWGRFAGLHLEAVAGRSTLLSREQVTRLHTPPKGAEPAYAAGWIVTERPWGGRVLTHAGSNTMWYCVAWLAPEKGFGVLVCCNEAGARATTACDEAASALIREHLRGAR